MSKVKKFTHKNDIDKRTPKNKDITLSQIIKNRGYYDINHNWNSIIKVNGYDNKIFRYRVEVLIINSKNEIFLDYHNNKYRIPGGSIERNHSLKYQVATEAREEAYIILGDIIDTGYSYVKLYKNKYTNCKVHWDGTFNKVYVGKFRSYYHGKVRKSVQDTGISKYGRFVPLEQAMNILNNHHIQALLMYYAQLQQGD